MKYAALLIALVCLATPLAAFAPLKLEIPTLKPTVYAHSDEINLLGTTWGQRPIPSDSGLAARQAPIDVMPRQEIARLGRGTVTSVAWLADDVIAVAGSAGLWLYDDQFQDLAFVGEFAPNQQFAWNPNGKQFAAFDPSGALSLWEFDPAWSARMGSSLQIEGGITALAWDESGARFALGQADGSILTFAANGSPFLTLQLQTSAVTALVWSGDTLAGGDEVGHLSVWDTAAETKTVLTGHQGAIYALAWSDDKLASGGTDRIIKIWEDGELSASLEGHPAQINALSWTGDKLASASGAGFRGGQVRIWDTESAQTLSLYTGTAAMTQLAWRGDLLLASGGDNLVRLWDQTGAALAVLQDHMGTVEDVAWSPDGTELACAGDDGTLRIWFPSEDKPIAAFTGHTSGINAVAWSPRGDLIATGGWDNTVRVWVRGSGKSRAVLHGHHERVWSVAWHPEGRLLASASRDMTVRVWNAYTGELLMTLSDAADQLVTVRWSPDGTQLAASSDDGAVWVWEAASGTLLYRLDGHIRYVFTLAWHPDPDKHLLMSGSWYDGTLRVWDTETGSRVGSYDSLWVYSMAWNPTGNLFATGDWVGVIRIWDTDSGEVLRFFDDNNDAIYALAWRPDGQVLASASADGTLRLWGE